jgi:hypothetical protein
MSGLNKTMKIFVSLSCMQAEINAQSWSAEQENATLYAATVSLCGFI